SLNSAVSPTIPWNAPRISIMMAANASQPVQPDRSSACTSVPGGERLERHRVADVGDGAQRLAECDRPRREEQRDGRTEHDDGDRVPEALDGDRPGDDSEGGGHD